MKKLSTLVILSLFPFLVNAQFGEIHGTVISSLDGKPLPGATVSYYSGGMLKGVVTDSLGKYRIKPLAPGSYDIRFSYVTFAPMPVSGVMVNAERITFVDATLLPDNNLPIVDIPYVRPLIDPGTIATIKVIETEEIEQSVTRDIKDLVSTAGGVHQSDDGASLNIRGSRSDATQYYVDGIKMIGPFSLPKGAISEITIITGGVPAQYGDATGGIILITTKSFRTASR